MIPICLLLWELRVRNKHSPPWIPLSNEMKNKSFGLLPRKISVKYSELIGGGLFIQQVFIEHLLCVICWTVNKVHMALIHRELTVPSPCKVSLALFVTGLILALFLIETLLSLSFKWREVHFLGHMIKKNRRSLEPSKDNSDFFFFFFCSAPLMYHPIGFIPFHWRWVFCTRQVAKQNLGFCSHRFIVNPIGCSSRFHMFFPLLAEDWFCSCVHMDTHISTSLHQIQVRVENLATTPFGVGRDRLNYSKPVIITPPTPTLFNISFWKPGFGLSLDDDPTSW